MDGPRVVTIDRGSVACQRVAGRIDVRDIEVVLYAQ